MKTITLYRPIGQKEHDLLEQCDFSAWPPRLPEQPIFYPVTNEEYATQIAREWNTKDKTNGCIGYVTRFQVDAEYLAQFPIKQVGGATHTEYWIPAEELEKFNAKIEGKIEVIKTFVDAD